MGEELTTGATGDVAASTETESTVEQTTDTGDVTGTQEGETAVVEQQEDEKKQSSEVDSAFAKIRREKEDAEKEIKRRDTWVSQKYGKTHGLHTWADFERAAAEEAAQQQASQLAEQQGIPEELARRILLQENEINNLKQRDTMREVDTRNMRQKDALKDKMFFKELEPDIDALIGANPAVDVETAFKYLRGERMEDLVKQREQDARKQATQQALNNINGKAHLKSEGSGDEIDTTSVPPETMAMYKRMNPKWTTEQIVKDYKKNNPRR